MEAAVAEVAASTTRLLADLPERKVPPMSVPPLRRPEVRARIARGHVLRGDHRCQLGGVPSV